MNSAEIIIVAQGVRQIRQEWQQFHSHLYARIIDIDLTVRPLDGRSVTECRNVFITATKDGSVFGTKCSREEFESRWSSF